MTYGEPRGRHAHGTHPATSEDADAGWQWAEPATDGNGWASEPAPPSWPTREPEPGYDRAGSYRDDGAYDFGRGPDRGSDAGSGYPTGSGSVPGNSYHAGSGYEPDASGHDARRIGYEPGVRWPTRETDPGWPHAGQPAPSPPAAPSRPGREAGSGWGNPTDHRDLTGGNGYTGGRRRAAAGNGRPTVNGHPTINGHPPVDRGGRRAAPEPPTGGSWRGYLLVGTLLALFAVGLGGALYKSGLLKSPQIPDTTPKSVPTARAVVPVPRDVSPSASGSAPAVTVVDKGAGTFTPSNTEGRVLGTAGTLRRFHVEVENGINENPDDFATIVDRVLGDPRSWIATGQLRLQHVPKAAPADFTIFLASPTTSEAMCRVGGLFTDKFTSCRLPGQVIINDARWLTAIPDYGAPLDVYRAYAVNHEVGHELGHGHEACTGPGNLAPVMQQQTLGLKGCVANSWPFVNGQRYVGPPVP